MQGCLPLFPILRSVLIRSATPTARQVICSAESFSIVTVDPNELLEPFHDRCPLILEPKDYDRWLTPYVQEDPSTIPMELLRTPPSERMKAWRVKEAMNIQSSKSKGDFVGGWDWYLPEQPAIKSEELLR
jgi:hypothetical protein